jgi:hypothetical protein
LRCRSLFGSWRPLAVTSTLLPSPSSTATPVPLQNFLKKFWVQNCLQRLIIRKFPEKVNNWNEEIQLYRFCVMSLYLWALQQIDTEGSTDVHIMLTWYWVPRSLMCRGSSIFHHCVFFLEEFHHYVQHCFVSWYVSTSPLCNLNLVISI